MLGILYGGVGVLYLSGNAGRMMRTLGPRTKRFSDIGGTTSLAVLFGLNIPACAAPLLAALLAPAALGVARVVEGFITLAAFGLGLSYLSWRPCCGSRRAAPWTA